MGNISHGGCGFGGESDDFEPFHDTGGEVRVLIVALNYNYSRGNELTGISDGERMEKLCRRAGVEDVTFIKDDVPMSDETFPNRKNVKRWIQDVASRCGESDYFVFFYAGHGENVPDHPPLDEDDGQDEALVTPGPDGQLLEEFFFIDDEFVAVIESSVPPSCRILLLFDCCHSATMADVDSYSWKQHRIVSISACQDNEESTDTGRGGILTIAMDKAMSDLALSRGDQEYSIDEVYQRAVRYAGSISNDQELNIQHANMDPTNSAWPLPHPWWK